MATIFLFPAIFFATILMSFTLGIETSQQNLHSQVYQSGIETKTQEDTVINKYSESTKAHNSVYNSGEIGEEKNVEQEPNKAYISAGSPAQQIGDLEKSVIANRLKAVSELLKKRFQAQDLNESKTAGLFNEEGFKYFSELPKDLQNAGQDPEKQNDLSDEWNERKILTGKDNCVAPSRTGCYNFRLQGQVKAGVVSASLWLHQSLCGTVVQSQTVIVSQVVNRFGFSTVLSRERTILGQEWLKINVTSAVLRWAKAKKEGISLAFTCVPKNFWSRAKPKTTSRRKLPLLVIEFALKRPVGRVKRSEEECNRISECCKVPLTINPSELNFSDHTSVISTNLTINYCFGSCIPVDLYFSNHTMYRSYYATQVSDNLMANQLRSCCVPTRLEPGSLMVMESGAAVVKTVSRLKVLECGCS